MAYDNDQNEPNLPSGNETKQERNAADLLPRYFRTAVNKKFLYSTVDQLLSPGTVEKISAFYGRKTAKSFSAEDNYINEISADRQNYQFEPVVVRKDNLGNITFTKDYIDYINQLKILGGNTSNHSTLNSQEYYSWNSNIDWDKFVNFREYYWLPEGPEIISITGQQQQLNSQYTVKLADNLDNYAYVLTPDGLTQNPTITLYRGVTYQFSIDTPGMPFTIKTARTLDLDNIYDDGVASIPDVDKQFVEKGTVTFTVNYNTPDTLYYVSQNDINAYGLIKIADIEENTTIDVEKEIIGKKTYTLQNGTKLSNGMKINFKGVVTPVKYATDEWYVEGVGSAIVLIKERDLLSPNDLADETIEAFDAENFDETAFEIDNPDRELKDYIVIKKNSPDLNPWTRSNKWVHKSVLQASAINNNNVLDSNEINRAKRPIIEFDAGLKLFNFGTKAKQYVDVVDTFTKDVFSNIEGATGYNIDGVNLVQDMRILVTADTDTLVKNRIYQVNIINFGGDGDPTNKQISLLDTDDGAPQTGDVVLVASGTVNQGRMYHYDGNSWKIAQSKTKINESPLFDLCDSEGTSYSDPVKYLGNNFLGNKIFNYREGVGTADVELGFPLAYRNFNNVGDILFDFPLVTESFTYQSGEDVLSINTDVGYLKKYSDRTTFTSVSGWTKAHSVSKQMVVRQYTAAEQVNDFAVDVYKNSALLNDLILKVYVDNKLLLDSTSAQLNTFPLNKNYFVTNAASETYVFSGDAIGNNITINATVGDTLTFNVSANGHPFILKSVAGAGLSNALSTGVTNNGSQTGTVTWNTTGYASGIYYYNCQYHTSMQGQIVLTAAGINRSEYQTVDINKVLHVRLNNDLSAGQSIILKSHSAAAKSDQGHYEIPINLESNPFNEKLENFTFGEVSNHVESIVAQLDNFIGDNPGSNNLRDIGNLSTFGTKFVQHSGPLNIALYHLLNKEINVIKAVRYAQKEYDKFKKTFLQTAETSNFDGTVREHVDKILKEINLEKNNNMPFYFSDMFPYGAAKKNVFTVLDDSNKYFALSKPFSMSVLSNKAVQVYVNDTQLMHGIDYEFTAENFCLINKTLSAGDQVLVIEYESTDGNYVPPTPTKLGLYPRFKPMKYLDDTYITPKNVIQGHDGSIMVAYDDYRDDLLIELEMRIYNNIKIEYDKYCRNIHDFVPSKDRSTGIDVSSIDSSMAADFINWNNTLGTLDFTANDFFNIAETFTYNHNKMLAFDDTRLPGFWRAVYKQAYDTDRPHTHPWEMLGFSEQPTWWTTVYGPAPYTSDNLILWEDLQNGVIREPGKKLLYDDKYKRTSLLNHLPVDEDGKLLSPYDSGYADNFVYTQSLGAYKFGDQAPTETAWRRSSHYPFSLLKAMLLNRPAHTMSVYFDASRIKKDITNQIIYTETNKRLTLQDLVFPNSRVDEEYVHTSGLINYVSNYIKTDVLKNYKNYQSDVKNLTQNLGIRVKGFTQKEKFKLLLDSRSPLNQNNVFVPDENYTIHLNTSTPIEVLVYSGVMVEKLASGYMIRGYDQFNPVFQYYPPITTAQDTVKKVGGISRSFIKFNANTIFTAGQIVFERNNYYRVLRDYRSGAQFDSTKHTLLTELPIDGGAVATFSNQYANKIATLDYGTVLADVQSVVNFLLGYNRYLLSKGFIFNNYNKEINTVENWRLSAQEFMFWSTQNWREGAVLSLSPAAQKLELQTTYSVADNIFDNFYDFTVLKTDGSKLPRNKLNVLRQNNYFCLTTKNTTDGIYFVKIPLVQKEHMVLVDNVTVFNDVIYDLAPGYRQDRIKVIGYVASNWTGGLNVPGFIFDEVIIKEWNAFTDFNMSDVVKYKQFFYSANEFVAGSSTFAFDKWTKLAEKPVSSLKPNFEYKTNQFGDFYDLDTDNFDVEQQKLAQHLIGYQKRQYLQNIINDDVAQYKFYQGFLQDKGTKNALEKLFNSLASANKDSIEFHEEWAIRTGQFGAVNAFDEVEYLLDEKQFRLNPQPIELTDVETFETTNFVYKIKSGDAYLTPENYDHKPFPSKYVSEGYVRTAGFVDPNDVHYTLKNYDDILQVNAATLTYNQYVWIAFEKQSWNVYKHKLITVDPLDYSTTIKNSVTSVAESGDDVLVTVAQYNANIQANQIISVRVNQITQLLKVKNVSGNIITCFKNGTTNETIDSSTGTLGIFIGAKLADLSEVNAHLIDNGKMSGELLWVENDNNDRWVTLKNIPSWQKHQEILNPADDSTASFGLAMAANSDNTVLAVANVNNSVYIYSRDSSANTFTLRQEISSPSALWSNADDDFGASLALSADGRYLIVGAPKASQVKSNYQGNFDPDFNYVNGDIVRHNEQLWQVLKPILPADLVNIPGDSAGVNFTTFDSAAFVYETLYNNLENSYPDLKILLRGDYVHTLNDTLATPIVTDHILVRASLEQYNGTDVGDKLQLLWNLLNTSYPSGTGNVPFDGNITGIDKSFIDGQHVIQHKVDDILNVAITTTDVNVNDVLESDQASGTVCYKRKIGLRTIIYLKNINGQFADSGSLLKNSLPVGNYTRTVTDDYANLGGWWYINLGFDVGNTQSNTFKSDSKKSLIVQDIIKAADTRAVKPFINILDSQAQQAVSLPTAPTAASEIAILSYRKSAELLGSGGQYYEQDGTLGAATKGVQNSKLYVVRVPKTLSDQYNLPYVSNSAQISMWVNSIYTGNSLARFEIDNLSDDLTFDTVNSKDNNDSTVARKEIYDIWNGLLYVTANQSAGNFWVPSEGDTIRARTGSFLTGFVTGTATVAYVKTISPAGGATVLQIYIKNKSGSFTPAQTIDIISSVNLNIPSSASHRDIGPLNSAELENAITGSLFVFEAKDALGDSTNTKILNVKTQFQDVDYITNSFVIDAAGASVMNNSAVINIEKSIITNATPGSTDTLTYAVSIVQPGNQFQIGNTFTVDGSLLGSESGTNDCTFAVLATKTQFSNITQSDIKTSDQISQGAGVNARFNIERQGSLYVIQSVEDSGVGYQKDDIITILGNRLGGNTITNDLTFKLLGIRKIYANISASSNSVAGIGALFNVIREGSTYSIEIRNSGSGYVVGDQLTFLGSSLEGTAPANNCTGTVSTVSAGGRILTVSATGTAVQSGVGGVPQNTALLEFAPKVVTFNLLTLVPGTNYTNGGIYETTTTGLGVGLQVQVFSTGGVIDSVVIIRAGIGYAAGDTVTILNIFSGSPASINISTVDSIGDIAQVGGLHAVHNINGLVNLDHTKVNGLEYWLWDEDKQDGILRQANAPFRKNRDYKQVFNIPVGSGPASAYTNEGAFVVYEKTAAGSYDTVGAFTTPDQKNNARLGSKIKISQSGNSTVAFVSTASSTALDDKIYFIQHDASKKWHLSIDPNYTGVFDTTSTYFLGDLAQQGGKIYQSKTNQAAGAFNINFWTELPEGVDYLGYVPPSPSDPLLDVSNLDLTNLSNFSENFDISKSGGVLAISLTYSSPARQRVAVYSLYDGRYRYRQIIAPPSDLIDLSAEYATSVAVSDDGRFIAVGSPTFEGALTDSGAVYVYKLIPTGTNPQYELSQTLTSPKPQTNERFGKKLDFDGNTLVISSVNRIDSTTEYPSGSVYIFENYNDFYIFADTFEYANEIFTDFGKDILISDNHVYVALPDFDNGNAINGLVVDFKRYNAASWTTHKYPLEPVNVEKIKSIFLYNVRSNFISQNLDYIDPIQGKIAGTAEQELFYKTYYDPAIYNTGTSTVSVDVKNIWGELQVGRLWWDLSTVKFYDPYQVNIIFQTNYWNKIYPGSSVDVYEWVESEYLPEQWNQLSQTKEGIAKGISGNTKYDNTVYVSQQTYDFISDSFNNRYYYWVKNKKTLPNYEFRKLSAFDVARLIEDPKKQLYRFVAMLSENKFSLFNCNNILVNKDVAINFKLWTIDNQNINSHNQYQLVSEGISYSFPKKEIEAVWFNSLIGVDEQFRPVPDPNLSPKYRYGTLRRPRQSWFVNKTEAFKQVIERINSVMIKYQIAEDRDLTDLSTLQNFPSTVTRLYDQVKDTLLELQFINATRIKQAQLQLVISNGSIISVNIIQQGYGYLVVPTYKIIDSTGTGAEITLTINAVGQVITATVDKQGQNYSDAASITVRKYSVLVKNDTTVNNKWSIHNYDPKELWQRAQSQTFDVNLYWSYVDWYAEGYNKFTEINHLVPASYELQLFDISIGDVVKIENVGIGGWLLLKKIDDQVNVDYTINYETIGRQNGTIQFNSKLYDNTTANLGYNSNSFDLTLYDSQPLIESRIILETVRDKIFIDELAVEYNKLFFASMKYVFNEQLFVDWAFKTSFVTATHNVGELSQKTVFKNDNLSNYQDFVNEAKPYKTKVREYISSYESNEQSQSLTTDFDLPPTYSVATNSIEASVAQVNNNQITNSNLTSDYPNKHWSDNVGFKIISINLADAGLGYLGVPNITITGGGGSGAEAQAYVSNGKITRIKIIKSGSGYLSAPTVIISGSIGNTGRTAKATCVLGGSLIKTTHMRVKFDRTTSKLLILNLSKTETFSGTGSKFNFDLKWPINLKSNKIMVTVNQKRALFSEYVYANTQDTATTYTSAPVQTTGASSNGQTATLTFAAQITPAFIKGQTVKVSGITPLGYNGIHIVTDSTLNSVSFNLTSASPLGSQTVAGNIVVTNQLTNSYVRSKGEVTFNVPPALGSTIVIQYEIDANILQTQDRVNLLYEPTTGMLGKDLAQLIDGIDYGGVEIRSFDFPTLGGYGSGPFMIGLFDSYDTSYEDEVFTLDQSTNKFQLSKPLAAGVSYNVYRRGARTHTADGSSKIYSYASFNYPGLGGPVSNNVLVRVDGIIIDKNLYALNSNNQTIEFVTAPLAGTTVIISDSNPVRIDDPLYGFVPLTVTAADDSTNQFTVNSTSTLAANMPIIFNGTVFGGIVNTANNPTIYFIKDIIGPTQFTISATAGGSIFGGVLTDTGSMTLRRPLANPYARMQTIIGDGSTTEVQIDEQSINPETNDIIVIRKSTSDGSFLPDPDEYDTLLSGGNLGYTTATGILAQDILIDGDGFVTPTTSKGPEELVPGQVLDTLDIQVYDRSGDTGSRIFSYNYRTDGVNKNYSIDSLPQSQQAVFVKLNNIILDNSQYTTDYENKTVILNTLPAAGLAVNIVTMGINGEKIVDTDKFIGDGSTFIFVTRAQFNSDYTSFVRVNGEELSYVLEETDSSYQASNRILIKFAVPPTAGSVINYVIYASANKVFSEVIMDDFIGDGSSVVFTLSQTPFNQQPLTNNVIVKVGNAILNAGYNQTFDVQTSIRTYNLSKWQQPAGSRPRHPSR